MIVCGLRHDGVRAGGDVVAAARGHVAQVRDDGLHLGEPRHLVVDPVGGERAPAGRVDVEHHAADGGARAGDAERADDVLLGGDAGEQGGGRAHDGPVHLDDAEHAPATQRAQPRAGAGGEVAIGGHGARGARPGETTRSSSSS